MSKATFTEKGYITRVIFFETTDLGKAQMLAEMQRQRGEKVRVEAAN